MPERRKRSESTIPRRARLFRNGRNQAVRIPRELEFSGEEVLIHREQDRLILEPLDRKRALVEILPQLEPLDEGLPEIDDPAVEPEDVF